MGSCAHKTEMPFKCAKIQKVEKGHSCSECPIRCMIILQNSIKRHKTRFKKSHKGKGNPELRMGLKNKKIKSSLLFIVFVVGLVKDKQS